MAATNAIRRKRACQDTNVPKVVAFRPSTKVCRNRLMVFRRFSTARIQDRVDRIPFNSRRWRELRTSQSARGTGQQQSPQHEAGPSHSVAPQSWKQGRTIVMASFLRLAVRSFPALEIGWPACAPFSGPTDGHCRDSFVDDSEPCESHGCFED